MKLTIYPISKMCPSASSSDVNLLFLFCYMLHVNSARWKLDVIDVCMLFTNFQIRECFELAQTSSRNNSTSVIWQCVIWSTCLKNKPVSSEKLSKWLYAVWNTTLCATPLKIINLVFILGSCIWNFYIFGNRKCLSITVTNSGSFLGWSICFDNKMCLKIPFQSKKLYFWLHCI